MHTTAGSAIGAHVHATWSGIAAEHSTRSGAFTNLAEMTELPVSSHLPKLPALFLYLNPKVGIGARSQWPLKTYSFRRCLRLEARLLEQWSSGSGSVLTIAAVKCQRFGRRLNVTRSRSTMDADTLVAVVVVGAPALAFAYQQLFWHASYQAHKLEKMDQSADETVATEKSAAVK